MANLRILCIHGIGHGDADPRLVPSWTEAIARALAQYDSQAALEFLRYDDVFAGYRDVDYGQALAALLTSLATHGIADALDRPRGLIELPDLVRWTAGMVAQWITSESLRRDLRTRVLGELARNAYDAVCAFSLGSLICYDAFLHDSKAVDAKYFVSLGSEIGHPAVRNVYAGRIVSLPSARRWFHLYNEQDLVFTAPLRIDADNFSQVQTPFDIPNDPLNHEASWYLGHANTESAVWQRLAGARSPQPASRAARALSQAAPRSKRKALLVGINEYPDPANRLEGCVNDVFSMSALLQESGYRPQEIRIVLNDRATAKGILDRLHWLLDDARSGDERALFYSGHGAQIPAYGDSNEVDHLDECLVPWDFDWSAEHAVTDNQFHDLYTQLPYDTRFVAVFDCCHSGGLTRAGTYRVRGLAPPDDIRHRAMEWTGGHWRDRFADDDASALRARKGRFDERFAGRSLASYRLGRALPLRRLGHVAYRARLKQLSGTGNKGPYLPVIFEACQESQLSYEYRQGSQSYGAFTYSFVKATRQARTSAKKLSYSSLSAAAAAELQQLHYDQVPALAGPTEILRRPFPWAAQRPR